MARKIVRVFFTEVVGRAFAGIFIFFYRRKIGIDMLLELL
jgi:hypothetical protein